MSEQSYSIDMLKKAAFRDEIDNYLRFADSSLDNAAPVVVAYLQGRIDEFDRVHGNIYGNPIEKN